MTECYCACGRIQSFGYKRKPTNKTHIGKFELYEWEDKFVIWSLQIKERYQNKGYGTQMLTEFLSQFTSDKPLYLYVNKANEIAIHLYEKVGFEIVGDFSSYAYTMQYKAERK